ncbi:MAG: Paraquat-inducible protein [Myxococcaceae bacterium]|nr:Paraquat-inducible protein [Myxococcaceae bacterium]
MSAPTNHWKLGLFVLTSVVLGLMGIVFLAGQILQEKTVRYTSFFDESVGGLNPGSSVSYRGVKIGKVNDINIARDHRHVEISYDLGVSELVRLGLTEGGDKSHLKLPEDLRVQLGSSGLTGTKSLSLDFFVARTHPPPELPFPTPHNYIPATSSTYKSLEAAVTEAVAQLPELAQKIDKLLSQIDKVVEEVVGEHLPAQAGATLNEAHAVIATLHMKLEQLPMGELTGDARGALQHVSSTLNHADELIAQIGSEKGVLSSVQRASDNVGDVAGNATGVVTDVGSTLRDLRETIEAIRRLAEALERDPDMLLKGRSKGVK